MSLIRDALLEKCDIVAVNKDGIVTKRYVLYEKDGTEVLFETESISIAEIDAKITALQTEKAELETVVSK